MEQFLHSGVDRVHALAGDYSPPDSGLVGNYDQAETRGSEPAQGFWNVFIEPHLGRIFKVMGFMD